MAQKRMFDKRITDSDKFMDLPNSCIALYFMAGMSADDRGFFQPRKLQRMCGFSDDDFKVLIAKRYFITFDSGVMVITDWNKNNYLDKNRITETEYVDELNLLKLINEKYEFKSSCLTDVKPTFNQNSIEENSIEENNIYILSSKLDEEDELDEEIEDENNSIYSKIINYLNHKCNTNFRTSTKKTRTLIDARLKEGFKEEDFITVIDKKSSEWLNDKKMCKFLRPETLFGNKFESYLNDQTTNIPKPSCMVETSREELSSEELKELEEFFKDF